jgi:MFS family permease
MAGQLVSQSGGWMQRIAQSWLVLQITDSPAALGTVVTLQFLPILTLSLFAGAAADRFPKRRSLVFIQSIGIAQSLALAVLTATGHIELWHVYVLALVQGTANAIEQPIRQAFPAELVGRDLLGSAIAMNSTVHNSARIVGPALGGMVVAWLDITGAFALNSLSYLAVLISLALMKTASIATPPRPTSRNPLRQIGEALAFAGRRPVIVYTLGTLSVLATFGFNYSTFLPLLARYELDMGPSGYGTLSAALGAGAILGSIVIARRGYSSPLRQVAGGIAFSLILGAVGVSPWLVTTLVLMALLGGAGTFFSTTANTTVQLYVPDEMRGRIMGLYTLLLAGMTPPGAMVTGLLADHWGIRVALMVEAAICLLGVLPAWWYFGWRASSRATNELQAAAGAPPHA